MTIKTLKLKNFKSYKDVEVHLGWFNVLIGANASGKSNLIRALEFLRDIRRHGLDDAIQRQGGAEYLTNLNLGIDQPLSMQAVFSAELDKRMPIIAWSRIGKADLALLPVEVTYGFSIAFSKKGAEFEIADDRLTLKSEFRTFERDGGQPQSGKPLGLGEVVFSSDGERGSVKVTPPEGVSLADYEIFRGLFSGSVPRRSLILPHVWFLIGLTFEDIALYDFDPRLPKKATPITGRADLEEDGSNLAIVLKNIIENPGRQRKLRNFMQDLVPFVADLGVERFADKSLLFSLMETYAKKGYLPASLVSDGTINITALIAALYFEKKSVAIIEEPERNIHPSLISKTVAMMKDASMGKQIIVITHNPEVVKHADIGDVLLVSRNREGFSTISRPAEQDDVKVFLKNEMGLEELFVQNLLHA